MTMYANETFELGPTVGMTVRDFVLPDSTSAIRRLDELMGSTGILLSFVGDIWHSTSVRRILWLQHHMHKFALMGTPVALLVRDHASTLHGFQMSSPLPIPFPMLADEDGSVHAAYQMDRHPGLLLIDRQNVLRSKWLMPTERVWPRINEIVLAIQAIGSGS